MADCIFLPNILNPIPSNYKNCNCCRRLVIGCTVGRDREAIKSYFNSCINLLYHTFKTAVSYKATYWWNTGKMFRDIIS